MDKQKIFSEIIDLTLEEKIKVRITSQKISGFNSDSVLSPTGIILEFTVKEIMISDADRTHIKVFPYLDAFQQQVWKNLAGKLFTILHEIGHIKTIKGLNETEYFQAKRELSGNIWISDEERDRQYRQLLIERKADEWATQWVIDHPAIAKSFSDMLESAYR